MQALMAYTQLPLASTISPCPTDSISKMVVTCNPHFNMSLYLNRHPNHRHHYNQLAHLLYLRPWRRQKERLHLRNLHRLIMEHCQKSQFLPWNDLHRRRIYQTPLHHLPHQLLITDLWPRSRFPQLTLNHQLNSFHRPSRPLYLL